MVLAIVGPVQMRDQQLQARTHRFGCHLCEIGKDGKQFLHLGLFEVEGNQNADGGTTDRLRPFAKGDGLFLDLGQFADRGARMTLRDRLIHPSPSRVEIEGEDAPRQKQAEQDKPGASRQLRG